MTGQQSTNSRQRHVDPLQHLATRGRLAVGNPATNNNLLSAGLRYRDLHAGAGIAGLRSLDHARIIVDGGQRRYGSVSDDAEVCRRKLILADAAIGRRCLPILRSIVVDELPVCEMRHLVVEVTDKNARDALIVDRLREGLHRLADLWGLHATGKQGQILSWRDA